MNKISNWISVNLDRICHFCVCVVISILIGAILFRTTEGATPIVCAGCGLVGSFIVGVMKELYDHIFTEGVFDLKDLLGDVLGGLLGSAIFLLLFV